VSNLFVVEMQGSEVKIWKKKNLKHFVKPVHGENAKLWGEDIKKKKTLKAV